MRLNPVLFLNSEAQMELEVAVTYLKFVEETLVQDPDSLEKVAKAGHGLYGFYSLGGHN